MPESFNVPPGCWSEAAAPELHHQAIVEAQQALGSLGVAHNSRLERGKALTGEYLDDFHAVYDLYFYDPNSGQTLEELRDYLVLQELTHIAEGFELKQRQVRTMPFRDGKVVEPITGRHWTDVNLEGILEVNNREADVSPEHKTALLRRREADVRISRHCDKFMAEAEQGEAFVIATPFQEEAPVDVAKSYFGHWPNKRRSFLWLGRKISEDTLEWTDITIDDSSVDTHIKLLARLGIEVPPGTPSHEIPHYIADGIELIKTDEERDKFISSLRREYYLIQNGAANPSPPDERDAMDFLNENGQPLVAFSVKVQEAIAQSIKSQSMHPLVQQSAHSALRRLNCLSLDQRLDLRKIAAGQQNIDAFRTLIRAQRYGIWEAMNAVVTGRSEASAAALSQPQHSGGVMHPGQAHQVFGYIYSHTNNAASRGETMPGCQGGSRFKTNLLDKDPDKAFLDIFDKEQHRQEHTEESDGFGSLKFQCQNGHWNKRKRAKTPKDFEPICKVCKVSVACQEPTPESNKKPIFQTAGETLFKMVMAAVAESSKTQPAKK